MLQLGERGRVWARCFEICEVAQRTPVNNAYGDPWNRIDSSNFPWAVGGGEGDDELDLICCRLRFFFPADEILVRQESPFAFLYLFPTIISLLEIISAPFKLLYIYSDFSDCFLEREKMCVYLSWPY